MTRSALFIVLLAAACTKQEPTPASAPPPKPEPMAARPVEPAPTTAAAPAAEKKRVDIKVTMHGYEPATVPLKTKEPVTLVFTRTEPTNCGSEVQIAALKWKQPLPM